MLFIKFTFCLILVGAIIAGMGTIFGIDMDKNGEAILVLTLVPLLLFLVYRNYKKNKNPNYDDQISEIDHTSDEVQMTEKDTKGGYFFSLIRFLILFGGPIVIANSLLTLEQRELVSEGFVIYVLFVIPFILLPKRRRMIARAGLVLGIVVAVVFAISQVGSFLGISADDLTENPIYKVIFVVMGVVAWFVGMRVWTQKSSDPEVKKLAEQNSFTKGDFEIFVKAGAIIGLVALGYVIWKYQNSIIEIFINMGLVVGFVLTLFGLHLIGKPDRRFKTGYKDNIEPNWRVAIPCLVIGVPWFCYAVFS